MPAKIARHLINSYIQRPWNITRQIIAGRKGPSFLIIGGQKCGTTTLWKYLNEHTDIRMSYIKELHYFDGNNFGRNKLWYRSHFDVSAEVSGEATPAYCFWPGALERIFHFDPKMKLIMILRNPIDRAISHYWMEFNRNQETLEILEAFSSEAQRLSTGEVHELRHHSYLARGRYHDQLDEIYKYFDSKQVLVCRLEDLINKTQEVIENIFVFLSVQPYQLRKSLPFNFKGQYSSPIQEARKYLQEYFAPHNKILADKYGIGISDWN